MISIHEAQNFQAIKGIVREEIPPDAANCTAVYHVVDTVIVFMAENARGTFPESVICKPPV